MDQNDNNYIGPLPVIITKMAGEFLKARYEELQVQKRYSDAEAILADAMDGIDELSDSENPAELAKPDPTTKDEALLTHRCRDAVIYLTITEDSVLIVGFGDFK